LVRILSSSLTPRRRFLSDLDTTGFRGGPVQALFLGPLAIEFQEAGENLVAEVVGPAVAPWLLAAAGWEFLVAGC
jgi:hypothetical protein